MTSPYPSDISTRTQRATCRSRGLRSRWAPLGALFALLVIGVPDAQAQAPQIVAVDNDVTPASDGTVTIEAVVEEGGGLLGVDLRLRPDGAIEWLTQPMVAVDAQRFRAVVSPEQMAPIGIDYYVLAKSTDGVTEVTSPDIAPGSFYEVSLSGSGSSRANDCASAPISGAASGWFLLTLWGLRRRRAPRS
ncbi:MAG: hypothetical protein ACI81R_002956 [Bradymonadia bacterium]|jgi:hypothetical protein